MTMKFNKDKFAHTLRKLEKLAKKKYPEVMGWTAIAHIWEDGDFKIKFAHGTKMKVYHEGIVLSVDKRNIKSTKEQLEEDILFYSQKKLERINKKLEKLHNDEKV